MNHSEEMKDKLKMLVQFEKENYNQMMYGEIRKAFEGRLCFHDPETLIDVLKQQLKEKT